MNAVVDSAYAMDRMVIGCTEFAIVKQQENDEVDWRRLERIGGEEDTILHV